jgi:pyruvate,water dikinase
MKILQRLSEILRIKPSEEKQKRKEPFLSKYESFREILTQNNYALELMVDLEEKLSGEDLIDRRYVDYNINAITTAVKKIIDDLNLISRSRYAGLTDSFNKINSALEELLTEKKEIPFSRYTLSFEEIDKEMTDVVGAKNANLGELRNRVGVCVPDGFAVSNFAFKRFMEYNGLLDSIHSTLRELRTDNLDVLNKTSREIQEQIVSAAIPPDVEKEILDSYSALSDKYGREVMVSVRSSAFREDGIYSFAGQYATFLNVPPDLILQKYKEVVASLFTSRALFYYKTKGLSEYEIAMSVGILAMIDAKDAGVIYSRDPANLETGNIVINAVRGLGRCVVEGTMAPQTYIVSRTAPLDIIERNISETSGLVCGDDGEPVRAELPDTAGTPLDDEQIKALARYAVIIEDHYNYPQDIEWAIDKNDRICILQTRPLMVSATATTKPVPSRVEGYNVLIDKGIIACKGIGIGEARVVRTEEDLKDFPEGAVLVATHTSTKFVTVLGKASAIVTDVGGATVHLATLAREFHVPTILDTEIATAVITNGQKITVDAINCTVYEGSVKELIEFSKKRDKSLKETQIFRTFESALKLVVPLNLIDPTDDRFTPEFCETWHDIIRFAHQKAMQEMFTISGGLPEGAEAVRLVAGMPIAIYVIDLGGGIKGTNRKLESEDISSIPFRAFLRGMSSVEWPEPRHVDVRGFLGMIAHTASVPEGELEEMGEQSFSFISSVYMNFSIRLGYHLSVVEAFVGEQINDNYIRLFFKGGGADLDRRLRRVKLISGILKELDFEVRVVEDVIDAVITKYKRTHLEEKLEVLGKMTVYTKQMDAIMYDDAATSIYLERFVKEHIK